MQNFRVEVRGNLIGDDSFFTRYQNTTPTSAPFGIVNCTIKQLEPTIIAPVTASISRDSEFQHYDLVANAIADSDEFVKLDQQQQQQQQQVPEKDTFRAIVLLCDVNRDSLDRRNQHFRFLPQESDNSSSSDHQHQQSSYAKPWEARILEERLHGGERYFIPVAGAESILLYTRELKEYRQLYAGRVIGVVGTIIQRDTKTNATRGVAVTRIFTAPPGCASLNPHANQLLTLASHSTSSSSSSASASASTSTLSPVARNLVGQRIHFCPVPPHLEGDDNILEHFLRDTILYLGRERSSSLIVFVGALIGRSRDSGGGGGGGQVHRSNMAHAMRETIRSAATKYALGGSSSGSSGSPPCRRDGKPVPLMFVPGVDDAALRPSVIPQSNLADTRDLADLINHPVNNPAGFVYLPANPAIFFSNGTLPATSQLNSAPSNENTALTIVATSIDFQTALACHSATRVAGNSSEKPSSIPKLETCAETLLQTGLCVPFLQDKYDDEDYVIEPTSLPELTVTPHIHFSPTSSSSNPQAFLHKSGTLFVSCNVGPPSFATGGNCSVMEVDVITTEKNLAPTILSNENVRVRCIQFIHYDQPTR